MVKRFALYEINNTDNVTRLGIVISPNELNEVLDTVLVLPVLPVITSAPFRIGLEFKGASGEIAAEKITSIRKDTLGKLLGSLPDELVVRIQEILTEMFK
jgi:mRNA interferase MazF